MTMIVVALFLKVENRLNKIDKKVGGSQRLALRWSMGHQHKCGVRQEKDREMQRMARARVSEGGAYKYKPSTSIYIKERGKKCTKKRP